jgi:hypothetical protein
MAISQGEVWKHGNGIASILRSNVHAFHYALDFYEIIGGAIWKDIRR